MITEIFIIIALVLIIGFDIVIAILQNKDPKNFKTISRVIWERSAKHPIIPFAVGMLMGHLFWRS